MNVPSQSRDKFSGYALMDALQEAEEAHARGDDLHPDLLSNWNRFIGDQFELDAEQRADLDRMCANPDTRIQEEVIRILSTPGTKPHFTLERESDESVTKGFFHQLRLQHVSEGSTSVEEPFAIAHCDANCRNWGWG